ncbi:MAG: ATP-binding protein [Endomicrobia bacterium]|nr:ATP-binding protein [Endomicrobiia bacterium]
MKKSLFFKILQNYFLLLITTIALLVITRSVNFVHTTHSIFIILITVMLVVGISFLTTRLITKPLREVISAMKEVSRGNLNTKISIKDKDELGMLVENFNSMISNLISIIEGLRYEKERIKNIFSSIQEAVVLLNTDGKILLYNDRFNQLCKLSPEGKNYLEVLISSEFNELVKKSIKIKKNITQQIEILGETYLCSVSFVSEKELVVLLYNITEHMRLQNIKKELISNIIHELKTPLTSIKGFAETMYEETKDKTYKHYLNIILANVDRLINIVNDLTTLSQLEHKEVKLEIEYVDLKELLNTICELFKPKVSKKNLDLKVEIPSILKPIKADKFLIEQLFINLLDNAVKYTEKGYIKISVSQDETYTYIEVEDTGIGIPKEYHQRIFERFVVVDKARSRQTGGTGLGLDIVKHIVELHKGKIFLESQVGKGTKFVIYFPLNII